MARRTNLNTGKVLILGNDTRVTLAVVRSLGRRGLDVHVGWHDENSPALASRYICATHYIPPFESTDDTWKKTLTTLLRDENFDCVIPCNDPTLIPLQLYRSEFEEFASIYLLDDSAFHTVFDKIQTTVLAKTLGISIPRTITGTCCEEILAECQDLQYPLYVKPRSSVTADDLTNKLVVQRVDDIHELRRQLADVPSASDVLVQEGFDGVGVGVEVLASEGRVLAELQHRRLHESMAGGSTYRETIPQDARLTKATRAMIESLNYSGVAMFEFRVQPESGEWVLLEINGRFWGSLPLAIAAGMDFPCYLYEMLVNNKQDVHSEYRYGLRARNLVEDLRWMKSQSFSRPTHLREVIGDLVRIATGRDCLDQWAWDDWRPQLKEVTQLAQSGLKKLFRRSGTDGARSEHEDLANSLPEAVAVCDDSHVSASRS